VVQVHLGVAGGADLQVHQRVLRKEVQHVVQEAGGRFEGCLAGAIQVQADRDLRLLRAAVNLGAAGG